MRFFNLAADLARDSVKVHYKVGAEAVKGVFKSGGAVLL
jgi:hypothetical protein